MLGFRTQSTIHNQLRLRSMSMETTVNTENPLHPKSHNGILSYIREFRKAGGVRDNVKSLSAHHKAGTDVALLAQLSLVATTPVCDPPTLPGEGV